MKGKMRRQGWAGYMAAVLACMVWIAFWFSGGTYARYASGASGSSTARVAKFEVESTGNWDSPEPVVLMADPENPVDYPVQVINKSEVAIRCLAGGAGLYQNLPLEFEMLDSDQTTVLPEGAVISSGDQTEHLYYLRIGWKDNDKDASYAGKTDLITITLQVVQED